MKCPIDGTALLITDRSGVEIDYCPQCRGVWLDRGELDKIIDRAAGAMPARSDDRGYYPPSGDHDRGHDRNGYDKHGRTGRRRREGFLGDLFDF
jgi:Zn-finger nucleic acid-binding protein